MNKELESRGARVLVIGGGSRTTARMALRLLKVPFPILHDPERQAYAAYGFGRAGPIQQSGTVLVDTHGVIRYVVRGLNPFQALDRAELLRVLESTDTA